MENQVYYKLFVLHKLVYDLFILFFVENNSFRAQTMRGRCKECMQQRVFGMYRSLQVTEMTPSAKALCLEDRLTFKMWQVLLHRTKPSNETTDMNCGIGWRGHTNPNL